MKKPPFKADNPEQAMQNFNEALRKVVSVSKEQMKSTLSRKRRAKKRPSRERVRYECILVWCFVCAVCYKGG